MQKIFLSHSSKNRELANLFSDFLESLSNDISVFCSSALGAMPIGANFENKIKEALNESDVFIPLLSEDFYKSRYCMIELGFAYSFLSSKYEASNGEYIMPLVVPPVKISEALAGTPLLFLQAGSIFEEGDLRVLISGLKDVMKIQTNAGVNNRIKQFVSESKAMIFQKYNFLSGSTTLTCNAGNVPGEGRHYISHSQYSDGKSIGYSVNFNLRPFITSIAEPDFVSFVYKFPVKVDLYQIVNIFEEASLAFSIVNFSDTIRKMDVEIKFSDSLQILKRQTIDVASGENTYFIKLKDMRSEALREISEICFVIVPSYLIESEREGMFQILNMRIETKEE